MCWRGMSAFTRLSWICILGAIRQKNLCFVFGKGKKCEFMSNKAELCVGEALLFMLPSPLFTLKTLVP